jgi:hypothetical protein
VSDGQSFLGRDVVLAHDVLRERFGLRRAEVS